MKLMFLLYLVALVFLVANWIKKDLPPVPRNTWIIPQR